MIKEFTIGFSRTINLGNYESARVEASVTCVVEEDREGDFSGDVTDAQLQLRALLEDTWKAQLKPASFKKDTIK